MTQLTKAGDRVYLIDTHVISEMRKTSRANHGVQAFFEAAKEQGHHLYLSVVTVSLTKNVPINKWIAALDTERMPADWASVDPRKRWRDWNLVRTALATLGLVGNVAMVGVLL